MTLQQMIEMVMDVYPQAGQTEITLVLKNVVDSFCKRSRMLRQSVSVSGTFATDLASLGTNGIATPDGDPGFVANVYESLDTWDLNNLSFFEVSQVQYNSDLLPRYPALGERVWWIDRDMVATLSVIRDRLVIGSITYSNDSSKAALTSSVAIRLTGFCTVLPSFGWTTLTNTLPVPEEFHLPIVSGVLKHFALKERDARTAGLFAQDYEAGVRQAMIRGNRSGVGSFSRTKAEYF